MSFGDVDTLGVHHFRNRYDLIAVLLQIGNDGLGRFGGGRIKVVHEND